MDKGLGRHEEHLFGLHMKITQLRKHHLLQSFYSKLAICGRYENRNILEVVVHISMSYFVIFTIIYHREDKQILEQKKIKLKNRAKSISFLNDLSRLKKTGCFYIKHNYTGK